MATARGIYVSCQLNPIPQTPLTDTIQPQVALTYVPCFSRG